ncbi:GNAT family N-acetyltransferase [Marine Group I thaumarchaeote]|uniref:GNAT family N-acetyltransferase n=1 Tax=Marine Group I thaumarchaeote TaxID=2511932 RepID=A0A7K4MZH3_9ARCH|nr:GNAT family N-acetyltransferase [Marine Group I thaumarchaeote]
MVQTRKARKNDVKSIIKLLIELGRPIPKKNETRHFSNVVNHYITDSDKSMFVALDDSKIIGMVSIIFLPRLNQNREEAWIPDLIINKKYQKHGIGTSLLKKCLGIAEKKNCYRIRLESGLSRKDTHKFYKNLKIKPFALSFEKRI